MTLNEMLEKIFLLLQQGAPLDMEVAVVTSHGRHGEYIPASIVTVGDVYDQDTSGDPAWYASEPGQKKVLLIGDK